jgi:hypothetical protein
MREYESDTPDVLRLARALPVDGVGEVRRSTLDQMRMSEF